MTYSTYFIHYHKKTGWWWTLTGYCKILHKSKFFKTEKGCFDNMLKFKQATFDADWEYTKPAMKESGVVEMPYV